MRVRYSAAIVLLACLGAGGGSAFLLPRESGSSVSFLSVGQGDCTVLRSGGLTILVDVGPKSDTFDAGARLIAPKLRQRGVDQIDMVFLTHPDLDHIGGLAGLSSKIRIGKVAVAAYFRGHPDLEHELKNAGVKDSDVLWLEQDCVCKIDFANLEVRLPTYHQGDPDNDGSLFIKWTQNGRSIVMTGDASSETELQELGKEDWSADILKIGHHGSSRSAGSAWLEEVHPKLAIISCGRHNRYGHPASTTMERITEAGAELLRTDLDGDIDFEWTRSGWNRAKH